MLWLRPRFTWLLSLLLFACGDASMQPTAAAVGLSERTLLAAGEWTPAPLIPAFQNPVLATLDDHIVLMGETGGRDWLESFIDGSLDMWEWNGRAWAQRASAHRPSSRLLPGLTQLQDKLVMFGGFRAGNLNGINVGLYLNETWEWDGSDWTQIYPLKVPYGRAQQPFVTWHDKVLMFGGQMAGGVAADTWTWNARDWIQQATTHAPEYCNSPAAAISGKVVMFCSARDADDHQGHTWEWDGDWHEKTPNTRPSNRYAHTLSSFGDRVVMYGGYADSGNAQETWVWDGSDWTDMTATPSPPARSGYQTAQLGSELVLYGGGTNETWAWNGTSWRIAAARPMPPARNDYALASVGKNVILFGGCCKSGAGNTREYWDDTWQWDGQEWTLLTAAKRPPGRAGTVLSALDNSSALLFGGVSVDGALADTWQWDAQNKTWMERTSALKPPARHGHAMATLAGKAIMFGGANGNTTLGDTWAWDGDTWQRLLADAPLNTVPAPGYGLALASFGTQLILITPEQPWVWNGATWSQLAAAPEWWAVSAPLYAATLSTPTGERLIAAGASWDNTLYGRQWDGSTWSDFPMPNDNSQSFNALRTLARPFASLDSSLVMLAGSLERTWVYESR